MGEQDTLPTTEKLARALEAVNDSKLAEMIRRAREGYYDDFRSPLALPTVQLVHDLIAAGQREMADRAIDGEWDATKEEGEAWARSPEGQEVFRELLRPMRERAKRRHTLRYGRHKKGRF